MLDQKDDKSAVRSHYIPETVSRKFVICGGQAAIRGRSALELMNRGS
jgi:hypothetical protein